jgi:hypothetical protein
LSSVGKPADAADALKKKLLGKSGADKIVLMEI